MTSLRAGAASPTVFSFCLFCLTKWCPPQGNSGAVLLLLKRHLEMQLNIALPLRSVQSSLRVSLRELDMQGLDIIAAASV